jgi:hypothetical protein
VHRLCCCYGQHAHVWFVVEVAAGRLVKGLTALLMASCMQRLHHRTCCRGWEGVAVGVL